MRRTRLRLAALAVLVLAGTIAVASTPAVADPHPAGKQISQLRGPAGGAASAASVPPDLACYLWNAPEPQYSSAGGSSGTVHYGMNIICNMVGQLTLVVRLYSIHTFREEEDVVARYGVGTTLFAGDIVACLGNASTRWITAGWASWNGVNFVPYPGWSSVKTLPCGSG